MATCTLFAFLRLAERETLMAQAGRAFEKADSNELHTLTHLHVFTKCR